MENYFSIGKLVATFGVKGELVLKHHLGKKTALKGAEVLFVEEKENSFIPYFIQAARIRNAEEIFIRLEGIDSKEAARKLLQKAIYFTSDNFKKFAAADSSLSLLGYTVTDQFHGPLGEILEIIELPGQVLAKTLYKGKEMLLPLNKQTVLHIHKSKKQVELLLPEGLIEVYLTQ